jgi:hypothetical protein
MLGAIAKGRLFVVVGPDADATCDLEVVDAGGQFSGVFSSGGVNCSDAFPTAAGTIVCLMPAHGVREHDAGGGGEAVAVHPHRLAQPCRRLAERWNDGA